MFNYFRVALVMAATALLPSLAKAQATELFFSEYIEGSASNKAIEIFNGTGAPVNLATYSVRIFSNGSATPTGSVTLTGTLASGDVFVICNSASIAGILGVCDLQNNTVANFNGDDALDLRNGSTVLDVFGQIGFDPGTNWGTAPDSTLNTTLVRDSVVCQGDTNGSNAFDPGPEWTGSAQDTTANLGSHSASCSAAVPTLSIATTASVAEGNTGCVGGTTALNFTVTSSSPAASNINFTFTTADGTAASGSDFTSTGTGTITTGNSTGNATVQVSCDDTYEADETFTVTLTDVSNPAYDLGSPITGTGTISNDDAAPTIQVSAASVNLGESGSATFDVTLSGAPIGSTVFNVASNDTGAATVSPATLTFSPGDFGTPQTVTVSGVADVDLANELATVSITSAGYTTTNVTANVTDDDTQAIVVSPTSLGLTEGTGSTLNVSLAFQPAGTVTVNVASLDAGAASATPASLVFTPADYFTTQPVTVAGEQDVDTANESTSIEFTASGINTTSVAVTVTDDDTALPTVTLTGGNAVVEGNGCTTSNVAFTASSSQPAGAGGLTVHYTIAAGTADAGDLTIGAGSVVIPQSASTANFNVPVNCDFAVESNETFDVALAADAGYSIGSPSSASGTITNDDVNLTLSLAPVSQSEGSGTSTMTFTATLNQAVPAGYGPVAFTLSTANSGAGAGAASAGSDYVALSEAKSIAEGASSATFVVTINGDTTVEADETFNVEISATSGQNTTFPSNPAAVGTIQNDDANTTVSVPATASIAEGNTGTSTVAVTVSTDIVPTGATATVDYATSGSSATSGIDFVGTTGTATIACAAGPTLPCTATINVTVNGDLRAESDETFTLTISNPQGTNVLLGNATTTVTLTNDDTVAERTIAQIQGDGSATTVPAAPNNIVATLGNVITQKVATGFYMQMPAGDGDIETSDAIFVFTNAAHPALAALDVGDLVDVRGPVIEFNGVTEFTTGAGGLPLIQETGTAALPAAFVLDDAMPSPVHTAPFCDTDFDGNADVGDGQFAAADSFITRNYECLEFMRVSTATGVVNGPNQTFGSDPYAEMHMTAGGVRAFREEGVSALVANENVAAINLTPPAPPLPAGVVWDGNPELFELDVDKFFSGTPKNVLPPGTTFSANGLLGFEFGGYEFWVTPNSGNTDADLNVTASGPSLPVPVPTSTTTQLTVGSLNVLRLYDYCDDPGTTTSNEPVNIADTDRKILKLSEYIRNVLRGPDVIGIQETEIPSAPATVCANGQVTTPALQLLANKIAADGGPTYSVVSSPSTNDVGRISVGFLVNTARVTVDSTTQLRATENWTFTANGTPVTDLLHDRPPLLLRAHTTVGNGARMDFAVMANHLRSLGGIDDFVPEVSDPSTTSDHENAHRIRRKKLAQAVAVACEAQTFQTANPLVPLMLVGDYNAFEFSDGYTDVSGIIRGDTNPAKSEYDIGFDGMTGGCALQGNGQIVVPAMTEALFSLPPAQRYSYVFNGNPQELDHAFLSSTAQARLVRFAYGRGNADAPAREETQPLITSPTTQVLFASDHDGFVITLDASGNRQPTSTALGNQSATERDTVNLNLSSAFSDPDNDALVCSATGMPSGLSISANCVISGVIDHGAANGSPYTVTVRATDTGGLFIEESFTFTVLALPANIFGDGFE